MDKNKKRLRELGRQTLIIQKLTGSRQSTQGHIGSRQSTQGHILTASRLRRGNRDSCRLLLGWDRDLGEQGTGGGGGRDFQETRISLEASFKCRWANSHGSALSGPTLAVNVVAFWCYAALNSEVESFHLSLSVKSAIKIQRDPNGQ